MTRTPTTKSETTMKLNIHATTKKIAYEHGITLDKANDIHETDETVIDIIDYRDECPEWELAAYIANSDGSYTFFRCIDAPFKEELPATIKDEKHFRQVLKFIGKELGRR